MANAGIQTTLSEIAAFPNHFSLLPVEIQVYILATADEYWRIHSVDIIRYYYYQNVAMKIAATRLSARLLPITIRNGNWIQSNYSHYHILLHGEFARMFEPSNKFNVLVIEFISKYISGYDDYQYWSNIQSKYSNGLRYYEQQYLKLKEKVDGSAMQSSGNEKLTQTLDMRGGDEEWIQLYERCYAAHEILCQKLGDRFRFHFRRMAETMGV